VVDAAGVADPRIASVPTKLLMYRVELDRTRRIGEKKGCTSHSGNFNKLSTTTGSKKKKKL